MFVYLRIYIYIYMYIYTNMIMIIIRNDSVSIYYKLWYQRNSLLRRITTYSCFLKSLEQMESWIVSFSCCRHLLHFHHPLPSFLYSSYTKRVYHKKDSNCSESNSSSGVCTVVAGVPSIVVVVVVVVCLVHCLWFFFFQL